MATRQAKAERLHYEIPALEAMSDEELIAYIIYTMQRKGMTEHSTALIPGYLGQKYDRPQGWHLLFWPFLGGYRRSYEWNRVFIENGELIFELEESISKYKYDLFEGTFLEKIFPSPVGETVVERYCPKIITHYRVDEFFEMQRHLPIKNFTPLEKHTHLVMLANDIQYTNPQREAAEAAKREPMTEAQIEALANAPILEVRPMREIVEECSGPKKTKFSRRLMWISIISAAVSTPVGVYLAIHHEQLAQIGYTWWGTTLFVFGAIWLMWVIIDLINRL